MEITKEDIIAFLKAGLTEKEIENIIESEKDFDENGITYSHEEAIKISREKLFSKELAYV